ncbi:sn-glycerol-3-phosphate import ATP-binding protein UgpC [soil metagenome]
MAEILFEDVTRRRGHGPPAVSGLSLRVAQGELLALLGPSGSGKSTVLRLAAGLERPTSGTVRFDGRDVDEMDPADRDVAMVFQDGGLYSHQDVRGNMGFALRLRRMLRPEIDRRVQAEARALGLEQLLGRRPGTLSAGQRQSVALGRAAVRVPAAYLLDEPLANVDGPQRARMRAELARLQRGLGVTTLYATNDQGEAMALGDRLAVLDGGVLHQLETPQRVYDRPVNRTVAEFVGTPAMNVVAASVDRDAEGDWLVLGGQRVLLTRRVPAPAWRAARVLVGLRPERLRDAGSGPRPHPRRVLFARADTVTSEGWALLVGLTLVGSGAHLVTRLPTGGRLRAGDRMEVAVDTGHVHLFDAVTGDALWHAAAP